MHLKSIISPNPAVLFSLILVALMTSQSDAMTAGDREKYEAKGLSQIEWGMIQDANMPEEKVDELLKAGITISEYFEYPWLSLGLSEREYIRKRKAGMLDADIRAYSNKVKLSDLAVIHNFFLPGYYQFKRDQKVKGFAMSGLAVSLAGLTTILSIKQKNFIPAPLFLLVGDMLWSSIDLGMQVHKERNPDAARFSGTGLWAKKFSVVLSVPLKPMR